MRSCATARGRCWRAALQAEVATYVERFAEEVDEHGHRLVVRNGYHAPREVTTAAGAVPVRQPRSTTGGWRRPPVNVSGSPRRSCRRGPQVTADGRGAAAAVPARPVLQRLGPALTQFLGTSAGLSAKTTTRLTEQCQAEAIAFNQRSLTGTDYVYVRLRHEVARCERLREEVG